MSNQYLLHTPDFWRQLRYELFWIYRGGVPAELRHGFMERYHLSAWYILHGFAEVRIDGHSTRAEKGSWLFAPPGDREQHLSDDVQLISIRFFVGQHLQRYYFHQPKGIVVAHARAPALLNNAEVLQNASIGSLGTTVRSLSHHTMPADAYLNIQSAFLQWVRAYIDMGIQAGLTPSIALPGDERIEKAMRMIGHDAQSYSQSEARVADFVGLSLSHFRRLCIAQSGKTWRQLSEDHRLGSAISGLRFSSQSIKEIAFSHGFRSSQSFSDWFHKKVNHSPTTFRKRFVSPEK